MNDGKQGISFDRWLMRIKDLIQILMAIGAIFWGGVKFIRALDAKDRTIAGLQAQVAELRVVKERQRIRR